MKRFITMKDINMKEVILKIIELRSGIKATDLALSVMEKINPQRFRTDDFHQAYSELVENGEIVELEYHDPSMDYRIKSILFRKGTTFPMLDSLR